MSKERLQEIAKELANNANMPYCWEDVYNRLIGGYPLPFKVEVKQSKTRINMSEINKKNIPPKYKVPLQGKMNKGVFDCINHKDENRQNNFVENLEWCDRRYNNNYGSHNKRIAKSKKQINCTIRFEWQ